MDKRNFQSAKFFLLPNVEVEGRMNKQKSTCCCIFALCLLIGLLSTFFFGKTVFSFYFRGNNSDSSENINSEASHNSSDLFRKKIWIPVGNEMSKYSSKLRCTKYRGFSFANYPLDIFTWEGSEFYLLSIYDHINWDLLVYFERIISQYKPHRLRQFFSEFSKQLSLAKTPKGFILFLKSLKSEKFNFYTEYLEKQNVRIEMVRFEYFFNLTDELNKWYIFLEDYSNFLSRYEQQKQRQKYRLTLTKANFKNILTKIQEKLYIGPSAFNCTDQKLIEINGIIKEWTESPIVQNFHSYIVIQNKVLLASEVNNYIKGLKVISSKTLYIFGRHTMYLDADFVFPGNNVALMAPCWVFTRKIKIILDGRPGKEHETKTASEGNPGKPGSPGENAGDFLGFGDFNEKFLFISSNGGKGGDGQDGAKGRDGANNTYPGPPINKPTCFSKIGVFINPFGQRITHYQAFSAKGCGRPGTDGGVGGFGGKAGKIILFINPSQYILRQGSDGMTGSPGKGGQGGQGGKNGCFYEVLDIDDEILHSVTKIKCSFNILPSGNPGKANRNSQGQNHPLKKINISLVDSIQKFIQYTGKQIVDSSDNTEMEFVNQLFRNPSLYIKTNFCESFEEFDVINKLNQFELFELIKIKINECLKSSEVMERVKLKYLNVITLGKLLTLKGNENFLFVDFEDYLLDLETSIRSIKHGDFKVDSISQLSQNGNHKLIKIKERLNFIRSKIETMCSEVSKDVEKNMLTLTEQENYESLAILMDREGIFYYLKVMIDIIIKFSTLYENPTFNSENKIEIHNFLAYFSLHCNEIQNKQFEFLNNLTSSQKQILCQNLNFTECNALALTFPKAATSVASYPVCKGKQLCDFWNEFPLNIKTGKEFLKKSLSIAECLSESKTLFGESRILLEDLRDELNHFIEIYHIIEWSVLEKSFIESLHDLIKGFKSDIKELHDMLISLLYNLAIDAVNLKVYPLKVITRHLVSSPDVADKALEQMQNLKVISNQDLLCENYHEAVFSKNSALGDFYFWPYSEIKHKLVHLFKGEEITLKANLNNHHLLDKNFIKFKILKLVFENGNSSLSDVLRNFQAKITHSGYSYYNWRGETRVVVSDEVTLDYWLRTTENGVPEVYNSLFKKFHNGDAILSPYTTWSVRLLPIHDAADFNELRHFENINIRLTGTGTFIS